MQNTTILPTIEQFKLEAKNLKRADKTIPTLGKALDVLATRYGFKTWNIIKRKLPTEEAVTPNNLMIINAASPIGMTITSKIKEMLWEVQDLQTEIGNHMQRKEDKASVDVSNVLLTEIKEKESYLVFLNSLIDAPVELFLSPNIKPFPYTHRVAIGKNGALIVDEETIHSQIFADKLSDYKVTTRAYEVDNFDEIKQDAIDRGMGIADFMDRYTKKLLDITSKKGTHFFENIKTGEIISLVEDKEKFNKICASLLRLNNKFNESLREEKEIFKVIVKQVEEEVHPDDESVAGVYTMELPAGTTHAVSRVLDTFHNNIPVKMLDSFDIHVEDDEGSELNILNLSPGEEAELMTEFIDSNAYHGGVLLSFSPFHDEVVQKDTLPAHTTHYIIAMKDGTINLSRDDRAFADKAFDDIMDDGQWDKYYSQTYIVGNDGELTSDGDIIIYAENTPDKAEFWVYGVIDGKDVETFGGSFGEVKDADSFRSHLLESRLTLGEYTENDSYSFDSLVVRYHSK